MAKEFAVSSIESVVNRKSKKTGRKAKVRVGRKESEVREFPIPSAAISRVFYTRDSWNKISANDRKATLTGKIERKKLQVVFCDE